MIMFEIFKSAMNLNVTDFSIIEKSSGKELEKTILLKSEWWSEGGPLKKRYKEEKKNHQISSAGLRWEEVLSLKGEVSDSE